MTLSCHNTKGMCDRWLCSTTQHQWCDMGGQVLTSVLVSQSPFLAAGALLCKGAGIYRQVRWCARPSCGLGPALCKGIRILLRLQFCRRHRLYCVCAVVWCSPGQLPFICAHILGASCSSYSNALGSLDWLKSRSAQWLCVICASLVLASFAYISSRLSPWLC